METVSPITPIEKKSPDPFFFILDRKFLTKDVLVKGLSGSHAPATLIRGDGMYLRHEESVSRDIGRIRDHIIEMAQWAETSLRDCMRACLENDHRLAYAVILRDQFIDEKEKEIDRLCLEFIIRQQPVSQPLRFAFSAIKLNMEIERVGDYAESMARHLFKLNEWPERHCRSGIQKLADLSINMFHDAIQAFIGQSVDLARQTLTIEDEVDSLRTDLINELIAETRDKGIPLPLLNFIRRLERVADQSRNICMEILYLLTGEYMKHPGAEAFRILFIDEHNSVRSQIAEAVANGLDEPRFIFASAGLDPRPVDPATVEFMKKKGYDLSKARPRSIKEVPNLEYYQVIVALSSGATRLVPQEPRKTIYLDWQIDDPTLVEGDENKSAAYEKVFRFITTQVTDLVNAVLAPESKTEYK